MSELDMMHNPNCPKCSGEYPRLGHTYLLRAGREERG